MDVVSAFLEGPRARSAFVLRSLLDPPWCLRVQDEAPLTVVAVVRGTGWVTFDDGEQVALGPGDVGIFRGPDPYVVADDPGTAPQVLIQPGGFCTDLTGESLMESGALGVRTWGNSPDGTSVLLCGTYQTDSEVSRRLLSTLPRLAVARAETLRSPLVALLAAEIQHDDPGQQVVLDRLLDLLLVSALRAWAARPGGEPPTWFRADADRVVGQALRLLHGDPARPWTVDELARSVGVSRALLSRRFHELAGEPPMTYLTSWRMALAADQLLDPDATVGAVARAVGYESPFTFSTAFKRVYGVSPTAYRSTPARPCPAALEPVPMPV